MSAKYGEHFTDRQNTMETYHAVVCLSDSVWMTVVTERNLTASMAALFAVLQFIEGKSSDYTVTPAGTVYKEIGEWKQFIIDHNTNALGVPMRVAVVHTNTRWF